MVRTDLPLVRPSRPAAAAKRWPRRTRPRRGDVVSVALLVVLPTVIFGIPAALGHAVIPGDDMTQNFPLRELVGSDIRSGQLPLYDPYTWSGTPLLADWNAAAAYPLTWLFAVLPGTAAWTAGLIATWAAAGTGMFCFLRALRLGSLAGFLGALSFAFAGAMPAQVSHFGLVAGMSWVPLALLALLRLTQDRSTRSRLVWTGVLAASVGLIILAGEPRAIDDAGVIAAIFAAWRLGRLRRRWLPATVSVAAGLILGICLGAVQWLPGLAAVATSQRATGTAALFDSGSLPVRWLLLTLVPDLLGGSGSLGQPAFFAGYNLTEVTSYAGVLPLVAAFALLGRLRLRGRAAGRRPQWLLWHIVAVAGVFLALGGNTPLGGLLYRVPLFGAQRLQSRNVLVLDLALAVLLAYWVSQPVPARWLRQRRSERWPRQRREAIWAIVPALAVVAVAVIGFIQGPALLHALDVGRARAASVAGQLRPWLVPYAVLGSAAALLVIFMRRFGRRLRGRLIAGFVVTDIVVFTLLSVVAVAPGKSGPPSPSAGSETAAGPGFVAGSRTAGSSGTTEGAARVTAAAKAPGVRPVAALGYQGRFAIYDPGLLDATQLSSLDPPDLNSTGSGAMPSVQGYSSLVDGRYAAVTGAHQATGQGQDALSPAAVGNGTLDALDTSVLLTLPAYLITVQQDGQASAGSAGTGRRGLAAGQRTTWYLGTALQVSRVTLPDQNARRDAATGTRIGLIAPHGRTTWFAARAVNARTLAVTPPRPTVSIAVTGQAGRARTPLGAPDIVSADGSVYTADGQLQDDLTPPRWEYAGQDGSFVVYADRLARRSLVIQALPGRAVRGAWVKATSGAPAEPTTAAVFTPHGASVVRSVAAIPGWTAAWQPQHGPSVSLPIHTDGLVQAVHVPAGLGTLTWSYTPPRFTAGFTLSMAATAVLGTLLFAAVRSRRREQAMTYPRLAEARSDRKKGFIPKNCRVCCRLLLPAFTAGRQCLVTTTTWRCRCRHGSPCGSVSRWPAPSR